MLGGIFFALIDQEDILTTGNLELLAKHAVEGFITGYHKSPFHGFSVEFAEHRQYNSGESIRHIDWRLYGRTDKLFVKRYEEETNLRCRILIDASSSMQLSPVSGLNKLQYAIWCSACFVTLLKKQRDAAGLTVFDESIIDNTSLSSSGRHYRELINQLGKLLKYQSTNKNTNLAETLHLLAEQMHRRSMLVLFSDLLTPDIEVDELLDAIQHLKHNKHELIIFNTIHSPTEMELDYGNNAVTFEDLESGETLKLQPNEIREQYQKRITEYLTELRSKMGKYKVDLVDADTSKGVEHAMIPFLVKRNRMSR